MKMFLPKLIVLQDETISLSKFKEKVVETVYDNELASLSPINVAPSPHKKGSYESKQDELLPHEIAYQAELLQKQFIPKSAVERLRIFTFTGLEVLNDDDLSMLENNSYLFVSQGTFHFLNWLRRIV
jgi:hypothetical protein